MPKIYIVKSFLDYIYKFQTIIYIYIYIYTLPHRMSRMRPKARFFKQILTGLNSEFSIGCMSRLKSPMNTPISPEVAGEWLDLYLSKEF